MPLVFGAFELASIGANTVDDPANSFGGLAGFRGFEGYLDEIAIYTNILSDATIYAHYAAATTNTAGYDAQILASSPIGYWNFDEPAVTPPDPSTLPIAVNSGTLGSVVNGTNSWGDLAGQSGPPYSGMGGATNRACFFDGDNGYVGLLDDPGMHISNNITMMAWVKPMGSINYYRNIIGHGWDNNYIETFLRIAQGDNGAGGSDGTNYYQVGVCPDGTEAGYNANVAMFPIPQGDVGNWVFVAGTYDGTAWNLYRNGSLVAQTITSQGAVDVTNRWSIGSRSGPSPTVGYGSATFFSEGLFFNGYIDEPAVFTNALSAADILGLYIAAQVPPVITRAVELPPGIYKGSSAYFDVWAEGNATLHYQWYSNGISTGATATNITLNGLQAGPLTVAVVVTNSYGSITSSVSTVIVASKPSITHEPASVTRYVGRPFSLSVSAAGTQPIGYQWKTNNVPIPGATSSSISGIVGAATAGGYSCTLSNEAGITNTVTATLTSLAYPTNYYNYYPQAVLTNVVPPIAYWRLGEASGNVAHDYWGGNDGTYFNASLGQPGYSTLDPDTAVAFSGVNSYAGNISGTAINFPGYTNFTIEFWANGPPGLADESTAVAKGIGAMGTTETEQFSVDVSGGNWRFFTTRGTTVYEVDAIEGPNGTWQHVVGAYDGQNTLGGGTNMYIYVNGVQEGSAGANPFGVNTTTGPVSIGSKRSGNDPNYDATFNGTIDEVAIYPYAMSQATALQHYGAAYGPYEPPLVQIQPRSMTNFAGLIAGFSVVAGGTTPLTYQWFHGTTPLSDFGTPPNPPYVAGSSQERLEMLPIAETDAGNYHVNISNVNGSSNSVTVTLTVLAAPTSPPAIPGLVMHLPFNGSLQDATGRGNNAVGIHINQNHGVVSSNSLAPGSWPAPAGYVPDGMPAGSKGLECSTTDVDGFGTNFDNFYATLGAVRPDVQFGTNVSFSVAYWVRSPPNYIYNDLPFFGTGVGSTFATPGIVFAYTYGTTAVGAPGWPGGWAFSVLDSLRNGVGGRGDVGSINDGSWHHLVHVFDRENSVVTTYLDGLKVPLDKQQGNDLALAGSFDNTNWFTIGQDPTGLYNQATDVGSGGSAPGAPTTAAVDLDDLGVWKKALTAVEAASLFVAASTNGLSFTGAPITITTKLSGGTITLSWPAGVLQSATNVTGPWNDVIGFSPITVTPLQGPPRTFYRVHL
jgi:hypothetical protein